ncbi:IPT/TIG domain-containing protein [Sphingobacterium psychroaquaticum]|uniref:IPT/TIG domain-containing protein n=1 Tax=Sphingobacterium psychroaquaticum TaxID=561061 RepID=A0A1X7I0C1_9SPHI|nr:IPT/TIG domain-containing protein [Sphingobacterium psychroaquaticum]SMG07816.1 IPT/TIG domain-containing protein [Sphingobacterium psychroaquaticum]
MERYNHFLLLFLALVIGTVSCEKKEDVPPQVELKVTSYYPNSGKAGTLVTIEGEGFGTSIGDYQATIGGKSAEVISATATALVLRMPVGAASGNLDVKYRDKVLPIGTYTYQDLSVVRVFPTNGPAGSQIRIGGAGFGSVESPAAVYINYKKALVVSLTDTLIVAEVPNEAGTGAVMVKVDGKEAKGQNFIYQAIHSIKPLTGGKGTNVVITGEGFEALAANNKVEFNGQMATIVEATPERLVVRAPEGVTTGALSVSINEQKTTGPTFTVVDKPVIQTVTPLSGPKGTEMVITGSLFSKLLDENSVYINNVLVPLAEATENQLKLIVPGGTGSGAIRVVVNDQASTGPLFKDQTLGISSVSPDNGLTGTAVTIKGTGFSAVALENKVYFNGVLAAVKTATETSLVLDAPAGLTTGDIKVVVGGQEAVSPKPFRRAGIMTLIGGPSSNALSNNLGSIAVDQQGNVYVTDAAEKVVKKITPSGDLSILKVNGQDATFGMPSGIVIDKQNNIYIGDQTANQIIKITAGGQRSVYASGFSPGKLTIDNAGVLYVNVAGFSAGMNRVNNTGNYSKINGPSWVSARPAVDASGAIYWADQNSNSGNGVARRDVSGTQNINWVGYSEGGYQDGIGSNAYFNGINGIVIYQGTKMYVADTYNSAVREVDMATRRVTTIFKGAGFGFVDGSLQVAKFAAISDIAVDNEGNIYLLDPNNKAIRKLFF